MFVVAYDLSDMPPCSQTFLRQRTLYLPASTPAGGNDSPPSPPAIPLQYQEEQESSEHSNLRYLIHLRCVATPSFSTVTIFIALIFCNSKLCNHAFDVYDVLKIWCSTHFTSWIIGNWRLNFIHRFSSSKSGRIYLHSDIRMIIFRKSDQDTASAHAGPGESSAAHELRSFISGPSKPKFSPRKWAKPCPQPYWGSGTQLFFSVCDISKQITATSVLINKIFSFISTWTDIHTTKDLYPLLCKNHSAKR
jgi:hypothetical protein